MLEACQSHAKMCVRVCVNKYLHMGPPSPAQAGASCAGLADPRRLYPKRPAGGVGVGGSAGNRAPTALLGTPPLSNTAAHLDLRLGALGRVAPGKHVLVQPVPAVDAPVAGLCHGAQARGRVLP